MTWMVHEVSDYTSLMLGPLALITKANLSLLQQVKAKEVCVWGTLSTLIHHDAGGTSASSTQDSLPNLVSALKTHLCLFRPAPSTSLTLS